VIRILTSDWLLRGCKGLVENGSVLRLFIEWMEWILKFQLCDWILNQCYGSVLGVLIRRCVILNYVRI